MLVGGKYILILKKGNRRDQLKFYVRTMKRHPVDRSHLKRYKKLLAKRRIVS